MGIKLVTFAAQTVTPQDDALIYETALQESGMIYGGSVSIKNANVLHVEAGHGALCGRKFTIEATDVPVPLTPSGSLQGRIYIHMDLSDTGEPISFQIETASTLTPVVQQSDVNINSGIYEINLATFIVNTSTISDLVNVAPFIDVTPDSEFNSQSSNSVQNKVITKAVGDPETIGGRASKPYSIGELILASDGQLYKATSNIAQNATIVSGGNADPTGNIVSQISNLANQLTWNLITTKTKSEVDITPITIPSTAKELYIELFYSTVFMFTFSINSKITTNRTLRDGTSTYDAFVIFTYSNSSLKITNCGVRQSGTEQNPYISVYYR